MITGLHFLSRGHFSYQTEFVFIQHFIITYFYYYTLESVVKI